MSSVGTGDARSSAKGLARESGWGERRRTATAASVLLVSCFALLPTQANAVQSLAPNVFAEALINGRANALLPEGPAPYTKVLARLQAESGSNEPIFILAARITTFAQQPHCGRVQFSLGQPHARVVFKAFAGQMNVCEDGQPPLRVCSDRPSVLVPAAASCASGKPPVDTEEVAAAIRNAGGMTHDQMMRGWAHQVASFARAASAASAASVASARPHNLNGGK